MGRTLARRLDSLFNRYLVLCLLLALFILTLIGVGSVVVVSLLGLLLCAAGFAQRSAQVDLWIFLPLAVYELASMASTFAVYGNIVDGYAILHLVFPVIYLLMACLDAADLRLLKQLCAVWTGTAALLGTVQFVCRAVARGSAARLSGLLGNPNAMGIFLVVSWFLLLHCLSEADGPWAAFLPYVEPLLLFALALTLSMGSFVAMAVGILVLLCGHKRHAPWRDTFRYACRILAKVSLGIGTGVLLYLGAARTGAPWICLPLFLYAAAAVLCWKEFDRFLGVYPRIAAAISALGILLAAVVVSIRPSSVATFAERLDMMRNGLGYLALHPLLGVGPFQWRLLNLYDSDLYFNTWHIHNALLHVGVEFGWIAMAALAVVVVRALGKKAGSPAKAGLAAFFVHNLMDTSFFYVGITALALVAAGNPRCGGRRVGCWCLKALFALFAAVFACGLYHSIR